MKRILVILLLFSATAAFTQNVYNDKVKLKNGSVIYGIITANKPGEYIELLISGREQVRFYYDEVYSIKDKAKMLHFEAPETNGYFNTTEFGFTLNKVENVWWDVQDHYTEVFFSIHTINGYKFNRLLHTGVGIGLDYYGDSKVMPLYASVVGDLLKSRITPFYRANLGWGFAFDREWSRWDKSVGGVFFNPALGLRVNKRRGAFIFLWGYRHQRVKLEVTEFETFTQETRLHRNFTFTMGLEF